MFDVCGGEMFRLLKENIVKDKINFTLFILLSTLTWGATLYLPVLNGRLIDLLASRENITTLFQMILVISVVSILNLALSYFIRLLFQKIILKMVKTVNFEIINHIRNLPLSEVEQMDTAYMTQRITLDSSLISNFLISNSKEFPLKSLSLIFNVAILMFINLKIGSMLLILIPVYIGLFLKFRNRLNRVDFALKESESRCFEEINSQFVNGKFIKINALKEMFNKKLLLAINDFINHSMIHTKMTALLANSGAIITLGANIIVLIFGIIEIFNDNLTLGEFTIITTYFNMVISSIDYFLGFFKDYQSAQISYSRIKEILTKKSEQTGTQQLDRIKNIKIQNINFSYNQHSVIKNFTFILEKGNIYQFSGNNGGGKSTLMKLILGLYDNYTGSITINGVDLKEINTYHMRRDLVSIVDQELTVIKGNLQQNIFLDRKPDMSIFSKMSNEFNLTEDANDDSKLSSLSGGEKQKINIIRSLVKNAELLILDEANSALDAESSQVLKKMIQNKKENRITIIISHTDIFSEIIDFDVRLGDH